MIKDDVINLKGDVDVVKTIVEAVRIGGGLGAGIGGRPPAPPERLPLVLGPLQQLESASSRLFDDRLTAQAEFKFDGVKGGI